MLAVDDDVVVDVVAAGELVAGLVAAGAADDGLVAGELDGDEEDEFDRILLTAVSTSLAVDGAAVVVAGVVVVDAGSSGSSCPRSRRPM